MKKYLVLIFCIFLISLVGCQSQTDESEDIYVLAAASLTDVFTEIEKVYENEHPNIDLIISYASSGKLERQIEQGAPADIFVSAGVKQMDMLADKDLLKPSFREPLLTNQIVLVTGKDNDSIGEFSDLEKLAENELAIGHPETVPAGIYAKETLESLDLWNDLKGKFVFANDVRQVLTYVDTGNVQAGMVYKTDVKASDKVKIVAEAPIGSHKPITYPIAILDQTEEVDVAKDLYEWLKSDQGIKLFEKYGFSKAGES